MRNELPDVCFSTLESTGELIILKRGEAGYYHSDMSTDDKQKNKEMARDHNRLLGVNPAQLEAMSCGSMFGWNVPGADPQVYLDDGKLKSAKRCRGHVKEPILSVYYPFDGVLMDYKIGMGTISYIDLGVVPEWFLRPDSGLTLTPDIVGGQLRMPVQATWGSNGSVTLILEDDCYTMNQIQEDYAVTVCAQIGKLQIMLGEKTQGEPGFSVWERSDGNQQKNVTIPRYFRKRELALVDMQQRVKAGYEVSYGYPKGMLRKGRER